MTRRLLLLLLTLGLATGSVALSADVAAAQRAQVDLRDADQASAAPEKDPHGDRLEGSGKGLALLFWVFAAATVGGALFVVTRRNLVAAVMGMIGSFLGISALYMMLYANFLAVVQMLVYAGAIMVLFVFVIMILNRPEDHPVGSGGRVGKVLGGAALLYLFARMTSLLLAVRPVDAVAAKAAPGLTPEGYEWGSIKAVGTDLFTHYAFPFEAISILLLVAMVGAIAIARPLHEDASAEEGA
jgi:NADH-quinone oxidoreductase subunit J